MLLLLLDAWNLISGAASASLLTWVELVGASVVPSGQIASPEG